MMRYVAVALALLIAAGRLAEGQSMNNLKGKKVVIIIASKNFRDEEFTEPYDVLKTAGAEVRVASSAKIQARGMLGKVAAVDLPLGEVVATNYDAVIFVGGQGAAEYFNDPTAHRIAKETVDGGKLLCGICIAPATLANAGVLNGKKATCFPSVAATLRKADATVVNEGVVRDGKLITADGPESARDFAKAILAALE
jgi:protease I